MVLIVFILVIVAGLGLFGFIFSKELKNGVLDGGRASEDLEKTGVVSSKNGAKSLNRLAADTIYRDVPTVSEPLTGGILNERYSKLEQLLEEKDRSLRKVEDELVNERSHRTEFEELKTLLQTQLDELKQQNKKLKEELAEERRKGMESSAVQAPLKEPSVSPVPLPKLDQIFDLKELAGPSILPLNDQDGNKNNAG